jgi:hypothetical protein
VPAFFRLDDAETLLARPVEIVGGIAAAAQADLYAAFCVEHAGLDGAAERRAVAGSVARRVVGVFGAV